MKIISYCVRVIDLLVLVTVKDGLIVAVVEIVSIY